MGILFSLGDYIRFVLWMRMVAGGRIICCVIEGGRIIVDCFGRCRMYNEMKNGDGL